MLPAPDGHGSQETVTIYVFTSTKLKELDLSADECLCISKASTFCLVIKAVYNNNDDNFGIELHTMN